MSACKWPFSVAAQVRDDLGVSINELGQPVGQTVAGWTTRPRPDASVLKGRYCWLERLDPRQHAEQLFDADQLDGRGESWTYLPYGPFADLAEYRRWAEKVCNDPELVFYTIVSTDTAATAPEHSAVGVLSLLRIQPEMGVIEVGHVHYSARLQRSRSATEAQYLLASHTFDDLGYRRCVHVPGRCHNPVTACGLAQPASSFTPLLPTFTARQDRITEVRMAVQPRLASRSMARLASLLRTIARTATQPSRASGATVGEPMPGVTFSADASWAFGQS